MADSSVCYGYSETSPEAIKLQAGPIELYFQDGYIRNISYNNIEIIRRVYFALRDQFWNTIAGSIYSLNIKTSVSSFQISFECVHKHGDIQFSWSAQITGKSEGIISYTAKGISGSTFLKNRIGFCVLHPIDLCSGKTCCTTRPDGTIYESTFPVFIEPWPLFKDIHGLKYSIDNETAVEITFNGDVFEMEDQRNWTDNSFKTYSTPASNPIPVKMLNGEEIEQKIEIRLKSGKPFKYAYTSKENVICLPEISSLFGVVPEIGTIVDEPLTPMVIDKTESVPLSHLRFDVFPGSESFVSDMEKIASISRQLQIPAELAIYFGMNIEDEILLLGQALFASQVSVYRFLIFKEDEPVVSIETILQIIPVLKKYSSSSYIVSGTDGYFVNLNRNHPPSGIIDQICYSANPQVHTFDNVSIMENLPGIAETLRSGHLFFGKAQPVISPLTLCPRKNRKNPMKSGGFDIRQKGLFCSAWTAGSILQCIEGGAASVTLFSLNGEGGIMTENGSEVYPVYHIVTVISEMTGGAGGSCIQRSGSGIASIVMVKGMRMLVIAVNLTGATKDLQIDNLPSLITYKYLDETTYQESTQFPEKWKCTCGTVISVENTSHIFRLLPYSVLTIEASIIN